MNQPRILKLRINGIILYDQDILEIDFTNNQRVYSERNNDNLYNLFSTIHVSRIMPFVGVNASGKTSTTRLISWILKVYFHNMSINIISLSHTGIERLFNDNLTVTVYFSTNEMIYCIDTEFAWNDTRRNKLIIKDEKIHSRKINSTITSQNLFNLRYFDLIGSRSTLEPSEYTFLDEDKSIAKKYLPRDSSFVLSDLSFTTENKQKPYNYVKSDPSIYQYLDSSIEYIKLHNTLDAGVGYPQKLYKVKFVYGEEMVLNAREMLSILSTGTRKGILVFSRIKDVFDNGGYIIIDEIENHFNKSIIIDIFKLFRSEKTNPKAATLILTTHYTELLDDIERNDAIFILSKSKSTGKIVCNNFAKMLQRNDYKKSDIYFSDSFNIGTAINYEKYLALFEHFINNDPSDDIDEIFDDYSIQV